jgi:outer membrane protein OmpA-like peptidoglycan-associated protein
MAPRLNRTAIFLNLAAFLGVSVFCVSTDAPMIQQDILKRCQDTLLMRRVSIRGLAVDGRDVRLSGGAQEPIVSPAVVSAVQHVAGVGTVETVVQKGGSANAGPPNSAASQARAEDIQRKIDEVLENQGISFKTDTTTLTRESELALDKIATYLAGAPGMLCEIRGYDIQTPAGRQNWVLALQRALAVEDYLEGKGIPDWQLSTRAFHAGEMAGERRALRPLDFLVQEKEDVRTRE